MLKFDDYIDKIALALEPTISKHEVLEFITGCAVYGSHFLLWENNRWNKVPKFLFHQRNTWLDDRLIHKLSRHDYLFDLETQECIRFIESNSLFAHPWYVRKPLNPQGTITGVSSTVTMEHHYLHNLHATILPLRRLHLKQGKISIGQWDDRTVYQVQYHRTAVTNPNLRKEVANFCRLWGLAHQCNDATLDIMIPVRNISAESITQSYVHAPDQSYPTDH